jgi:hypothetical protein
VAGDPDDFVDIAVRIATTPALRASLRERILRSCGTLYADPASVTALAEFLRSAARAAPGEPPPPRQ